MRWADRLRRTSLIAKGTARIVLFHRVAPPTSLAIEPATALTPALFRNVISEIAENHTPLSLQALHSRLRGGESVEGCVVVTFDDGFADNLHTALPILEEFQVPATIYVTSGFIARDVQLMEYELAQIVATSAILEFAQRTWKIESPAEKKACYDSIRQQLKPASQATRSESIQRLWQESGRQRSDRQGLDRQPAPPQFELLTVDQLRQLDASELITIGAHTHAHLVLTAVSPEQAKHDIASGKQWLETQLRHPVLDFAYPYGAFDANIQECVRGLGFRTAVTTVREPLSGNCDVLALPRIEVNAQRAQSTEFLSGLPG